MLYNGMASTSPVAALYFIALMTFGNYVLFNLLVAILVEGFQTEVGRSSSPHPSMIAHLSHHFSSSLCPLFLYSSLSLLSLPLFIILAIPAQQIQLPSLSSSPHRSLLLLLFFLSPLCLMVHILLQAVVSFLSCVNCGSIMLKKKKKKEAKC